MKNSVFGLVLGLIAGPAFADPLSAAIANDGGTLCFTRSYDDAWLKAHRGQTVREVTLAISDDPRSNSLAMRLSLLSARGSLYGFGGCWWDDQINRGVQNDILDPSFKPTTGVSCHMVTDITGGSAEEGAEFSIDWRDGRIVQTHLGDSLAMWTSYDIRGRATWHELEPADRVVRLNRAPPSACRTLVSKFAPNGLE